MRRPVPLCLVLAPPSWRWFGVSTFDSLLGRDAENRLVPQLSHRATLR